ncbi:MAG: MoxR family ATPase [Clostridiales Family XIII bacterium]|jgi:hypothetical protein|nr:MoxR family ATPase [Clostridiales Family XIII bacterium]
MNIKDAKEQIKNAMTAYFSKDEYGYYLIPLHKQRPVCMIGPPGIGKTAIMEQIASELGVGLVSYSMTHHTRQSALGLPFIVERDFDGQSYRVSEYTMSEIIGSVYSLMQETGVREGILFLDEINCVSETLSPCMLQFLQYKYFGQHRLPDGWIVVTAGNPPEYNKSVRDFDIVTWDRMKRIDVEPDYDVWREYAGVSGVHAAVTTYLAARQRDFYRVETTMDGKSFVTARGWDDLAQMIALYERNDLPVDEKLSGQYLQSRRIAKDFAVYYDLFRKYKSDYQVDKILEGKVSENIVFRAQMAKFDERLALLGLLFDAVTVLLRAAVETEETLAALSEAIKGIGADAEKSDDVAEAMESCIHRRQTVLDNGKKSSSMTAARQRIEYRVIKMLTDDKYALMKEGVTERTAALKKLKAAFEEEVIGLRALAAAAGQKLNNVFIFCEQAFDTGEEILLLVTELTANYYSAKFIGHYGNEKYFEHNKDLQFYERQKDIATRIDALL